MRNRGYWWGLLSLFLLVSCLLKQEGFEVTIDLKNAVDGMILVSQRIPNPTAWYTDTLQLKDGKAVFKGKVDYPRLVSFVFRKGEGDMYGSFGMFLDNSKIDVIGDFDDLRNVTVTGGKANDEYRAIDENGREFFSRYGNWGYERSRAFKDNRAKYDSLAPFYQEAADQLYRYITTLPGYATSPVAAYYVREYFGNGDLNKLEKALNGFDASLADNAFVVECREYLEKERRVEPGQPAYDFTLSDVDGKTYKLSDFRGKYVMLEFSASWCGWCKLEIPFLKTVYENTKGKDFVMFTVNLDENREKWVEDVKQYNLPWPVISDLQAFKSPVAINYNVSGIPMIYLIGPGGKIKEKGLRREVMIEYIDSLFKD